MSCTKQYVKYHTLSSALISPPFGRMCCTSAQHSQTIVTRILLLLLSFKLKDPEVEDTTGTCAAVRLRLVSSGKK